jgi:hypothetical protein
LFKKPVFQFIVVLERRLLFEEARKFRKKIKMSKKKNEKPKKPENPRISKTHGKNPKTQLPKLTNSGFKRFKVGSWCWRDLNLP